MRCDARRERRRATSAKPDKVPRYRARVLGIFDEASGSALAGVRVTDVLSGMSAQSSETGTVALAFLPDGGSLVRLQKIGYQTQTFMATVSPRDTAPITVVMTRITLLPKVVTTDSAPRYISGNLRAFQERMKIGATGYFIDENYLRKNDNRMLGELVRTRLPGSSVRDGSASAMYLLQSPRCGSGGPPQVYLDGVPLTGDVPPPPRPSATGRAPTRPPIDNSSMPFNLSQFQVSDLAAIEWYPTTDTAPVEFSATSKRCGVLLLWTRER